MTPFTKAQMFRDAADVRRWHTKRTIREQTVGAHTFGVIMLIQQCHPGCRKELLLAAMHHDLPELHTGDIPAPIKRNHSELSVLMERIESELAPLFQDFRLTVDEERLLRWADYFELAMWCLEEFRLGNQRMNETIVRINVWLSKLPTPSFGMEHTQRLVSEWREQANSAGVDFTEKVVA